MVRDQRKLIIIGKVTFFNDYLGLEGSINTMGHTYTKGMYQLLNQHFAQTIITWLIQKPLLWQHLRYNHVSHYH
jgi:hypothetical protein